MEQGASMSTHLHSPRQDAWLWRLFATGLAFILFGAGSLMLRLFVFPMQRLLPGTQASKQRRARNTISLVFRFLIRFLVRSGVLTLDIQGAERLGRPGQLIIANHPSLLDVALLIAHTRNANCIVKESLFGNPFTRGPLTAAGYIGNMEGLDTLERSAGSLRAGAPLIMFPEGTRTRLGTLPTFHRGACAIAMRGASVVTPVVISMRPVSQYKGAPWYQIPRRRIHYSLIVGPDLDPASWLKQGPLPIVTRRLNEHLHALFHRELTKA
ncbi:FIG018329: 1-acyl-sn-glycerol-3-phosphate acyltransferase [plant metagenome]|uniref:FIG018329: 1-acyl-sn-glycerol-3-phosphate acyltransferase n=1 Tax=plant metagenome TaxID=1297885 RepID=A0A484T3H7_9ZZZZ